MVQNGSNLTVLSVVVAIGGLLVYAIFVYWQTRVLQKQLLVSQESEWMPEVIHDLPNQIRFEGRRPWFPKFKAQVEDVSIDWVNSEVGRDSRPVRDWVVQVPGKINTMIQSLDDGTHRGDVIIQFESLTGEQYEFRHSVEISIKDSGYVMEVTDIQRSLPWE